MTEIDRTIQILGHLEYCVSAYRLSPTTESEEALNTAFLTAQEAGIGTFDIKVAEFRGHHPRDWQGRFDDLIANGLEGLTLDEAVELRERLGVEG